MSPEPICEILTSEGGISAAASEWRALHARVGQSPFTDYDWIQIWWAALGRHQMQMLHIVTCRVAGKLVGVLPLAVQSRTGWRVLRAAGHKAFHYCDCLCEEPAQAEALWRCAQQSPHYDFADIRDVYPDSMCYPALSSVAHRRDETPAFRLNLNWSSSAEWRASLSKDMRGKTRRCLRRLEEKGPVSFGVHTEGPLPPDIVDGMIRQKAAWSKANRKEGIFNDPEVFNFFRQLLEKAGEQKRVLLSWLKCGGDVIAYDLYILYRGVAHGYVIAYDPEWSAYGPGILLIMHVIGWGIDNGLTAIDYRQGDGSTKTRFSNETRQCAEFTFSRTAQGKIAEHAFIALRQIWRRVRDDRSWRAPSDAHSKNIA